jgi:hypothetical protein
MKPEPEPQRHTATVQVTDQTLLLITYILRKQLICSIYETVFKIFWHTYIIFLSNLISGNTFLILDSLLEYILNLFRAESIFLFGAA